MTKPHVAPPPASSVEARSGALTFGQFSEANRARCESPQGFSHPLAGWSSSDWMTAMVGEVGEAANVVKKLNRYRDGVPGNKVPEIELRDQLRKELGDVFVYLDLMCQSLGFNISDAAVEVFNAKSAEIGYPVQLLAAAPPAPPSDPEDEATALIVLARYNIPADIQELLIHGNPSRGVPPGALAAALRRPRVALRPSAEKV